MTKLTGAQALIKSLEMEGVDVMFGLPGGCILPAYDPLLESSIRHILVRHEQGAGHMAEGYAHVTGRPGVAMVTSGPAATNLVTPLMDAFMDSIPMVGITGQVPTAAIGTDAFQECDTVGITRSVHQAQRARDERRRPADGDPPGVPHRDDGPARPDARRRPQGRAAERDGVVLAERRRGRGVAAGLPADREGPRPHDQGGGQADPGVRAPGPLRRRWGAQGARGRGAARARRADRHLRRHHADGARRVPRRPPAVPRHAGHARQRDRGDGDAEGRPADRARAPASTTASPAGCRRSRRTPRSSTSTSIRPSRARCAGPTSRSSATAST